MVRPNNMDVYDGLVLICIVLLLSIFIIKVVRLKMSGINANQLGENKKGVAWIVEKSLLPLAALFMVELIIHAMHLPWHVFGQEVILAGSILTYLKPIGLLGIIISIIILFFSLRSFGESYRLGIDHRTPGKLVEQGVFRYSRNPIYLGLNGVFGSAFLLYGSLFFLTMSIGGAIVMHFMILKEEQALSKLYGLAYKQYLINVPRYFGLKSLR